MTFFSAPESPVSSNLDNVEALANQLNECSDDIDELCIDIDQYARRIYPRSQICESPIRVTSLRRTRTTVKLYRAAKCLEILGCLRDNYYILARDYFQLENSSCPEVKEFFTRYEGLLDMIRLRSFKKDLKLLISGIDKYLDHLAYRAPETFRAENLGVISDGLTHLAEINSILKSLKNDENISEEEFNLLKAYEGKDIKIFFDKHEPMISFYVDPSSAPDSRRRFY